MSRMQRKRNMRNELKKNFLDIDVIKCFEALEHGRLNGPISTFYARPAYQYTKAEVGGIR